MKVNVNKIHATIMAVVAVLMLSPCLVQAQDTSRNFVRTVTMLNAGGTDSLQAVQYYNGFGRPTVSVAYQFPRPRDTLQRPGIPDSLSRVSISPSP